MKYGHTLDEAIRLFSEQSLTTIGPKCRISLAQLPWLKYKLAKKEIGKALNRIQNKDDEEWEVPDERSPSASEPQDTCTLEEVGGFFAMLNQSLADIDDAFREIAGHILHHNNLAKALTLLQSQARTKTSSIASARWNETKVFLSCNGLSPKAATVLADSAFRLTTWAELNATATHKILKKFDKRLGKFCGAHTICNDYRQKLYDKHAFLQGPMVVELRSCCSLGQPMLDQSWLVPVAVPSLLEVPKSCPVCFGVFLEPVGLPCGHCLCRHCHTALTKKVSPAAATCPLCRTPCVGEPLPMRHLSALVQTEHRNEWTEQKGDVKAEETSQRQEREKQLKSLPASSRLMCMSMDMLN